MPIFPALMIPAKKIYRILVISDYRSVNSSRPEAEIFLSLAKRGHHIWIFSFKEAEYFNEKFIAAGITVVHQHPEKKWSRSFQNVLRSFVIEHDIQIVHAFNSRGLVNANIALRGLPAKLIAYRGYAGQTHWYDPMMYVKYFHPRVDHIICLSDEIREILQHNMLFAQNKLTTIHKGHHPDWYAEVIPAVRHDLGFQDQDILIGFVANVRPFKGLHYLLEATHLIPTSIPLHFIFIGNGYDAADIQNAIQQSPFRSRIHLLGYRKDSLSIVAMCDGLVLSSTHGEALTKSVLEAMSLGITPIITDIAGNKGVVVDGISGWVVPPKNAKALADAIMDFATHPAERRKRGLAAKQHIALQFHTSRTADEYEELYQKLNA